MIIGHSVQYGKKGAVFIQFGVRFLFKKSRSNVSFVKIGPETTTLYLRA
jgi:hypothetical protein